jgi:putative PIN family toxin of toxin-antitoxin system
MGRAYLQNINLQKKMLMRKYKNIKKKKEMKIVMDANIFVSSFFWGGNPRFVLERVIKGIDELFTTKEILDEVESVMGRPKFHADKEKIAYFISSIEEIGNKVVPKRQIKNGSRDKTDNKYIECGITADVDYIISGDVHLLEEAGWFDKHLLIGFDQSANLIEILYNDLNEDTVRIFHAMKCRNAYKTLLDN